MQTEGVREHPFFSQTAFLVGGFPYEKDVWESSAITNRLSRVSCASGTRIAPFYAPLRSALLVVCHWQTAPEPAGENARRGMSDKVANR